MKRYSKFFAVLLAVAMVLPGIAGAAPVTDEAKNVIRLGGIDREATAVLASDEVYEKADSVVLTGFGGDVDALTGTLLAADKDAPLLITRKNRLSDSTKDEIKRLEAKTVYILGGESAVPKLVEDQVKALGVKVERIEGLNRNETAANVAREVKGTKADHIFIALGREAVKGDALADALAIGTVSAKQNEPVLLVETNRLPEETKQAIKDLKVKSATIVGGNSAVSQEIETEIKGLGLTVDRVKGDSREETALKIAGRYFKDTNKAVIAYGRKSADALVGGYLGNKIDAPILLTKSTGLTLETEEYLDTNTNFAYVLGGVTVISENTFKKIQGLVKPEETELVVKSVKAISETVDKEGSLKFTINGEEAATELTRLGEAGYTVKFLASKALLEDADGNLVVENPTGKVKASPGEEFDYQVVVSKDGEKVAESERVSVKVEDYARTISEISSVEVKLDNDVIAKSNKLVIGENANFLVKGKFKSSDEETDLTDKVSYSVNRPAIATVDASGKISSKAKGKVTVTIKAGEIEGKVVLDIVDGARELDIQKSSIAIDKLEIAAGTKSEKIRVVLKDQYGDDFVAAVTAVNEDALVLKETATAVEVEDTLGAYDLELLAADSAATGNVIVKAGTVELGKIALTVKEAGELASWVLEADETELDIKPTATKKEAQLTLKGLDADGLLVERINEFKAADYEVKSSNENVAKILENDDKFNRVQAVAVGTTRVTVYKKNGAFREERAAVEITVVDSTPEIETVNFKAVEKITDEKVIKIQDIVDLTISGENEIYLGKSYNGETLTIREGNNEGVVIGKIQLLPVAGESKFWGVNKDIELRVKKQAETVKGKINITVFDADNNFVEQTEIDVDLPESGE